MPRRSSCRGRSALSASEVYIYNTLDNEVMVRDPVLRKLAAIKVCEPAHTEEWRRGKELFETAKRPMGGTGWVSCASCHPDGFSDGRVWQNPEGNRRTPHLFGLAHTHPLHWSADRDESPGFRVHHPRQPHARPRPLRRRFEIQNWFSA